MMHGGGLLITADVCTELADAAAQIAEEHPGVESTGEIGDGSSGSADLPSPQVAVEARIAALKDHVFEQIGIGFDLDGNNAVSTGNTPPLQNPMVQLPPFPPVTVSTNVSVPDGGTILLGGVKSLNEGGNESGVPLLNKLPNVNRLFKNVGVGRETQSLMIMVTPRIIIQED